MGRYDKEREALGLKPLSGSSSSDKSRFGKYAGERELLLNPTAKYGSNEERARAAKVQEEALAQQKVKDTTLSRLKAKGEQTYQAEKTDESPVRESELNLLRDAKLVERPSYTERVRERVSGWPDLLKPVGVVVEGIAQAPSMLATREALGTENSVEQGFKPVSGAGRVAGQIIAPIGSALTTPGAGLGGGALYNATGNALTRVAPRLGNTAMGRVAETTIKGATEGAITGAGGELVMNPNASGRQIAESAAYGAGGGAILGGLAQGVGEVVGGVRLARGASKAVESVPVSSAPKTSPDAVVEPVEKPKNSLYTKLFGNQGVGITAGKTPRRSGTGMQIVDNPLKKSAQTRLDSAKEFGRAVKQDYVDLTAPLKHLGGDVQDVALDARRANNLANTWVHDKAVTPEGNVIGVSLKDVIDSVPRGEADAFEDYLIVRHAKTRVARGEKVYEDRTGMNDVPKLEARQAELEKRYPHFAQLGARWDEYNTNLLDTGEAFGLISKAQKEAMRSKNPNYASMRRQFSTAEKFSQPFAMKSNAFSGQKAPIKAVSPTGSARKIVSPVRTAIEQTGAWMNAGMRNRVMQSILQRVQADPEGMRGIVELVPETSQATAKSLKEINDVLAKEGMEGLTEYLNQDYSILFRKASQMGAKTDNIVTVMVDGNPIKMKVANPDVFKSLVGMSPEESNFVLDFFGMLSNATKRGATGALAPLFAAKSITYDTAQALIQSKDPLRHVPDLIHATVSAIANKLPKGTPGFEKIRSLAQEFERAGGEYSAALRGDKPLRKAVGSLRKEALLTPRAIGKGSLATVKAPFRVLEGISDIAENVNRIAAYKGAMRRAGDVRTPETIRGAMRESQEITTNFSRKGAKSETIEKFIPYSNAAIQGIRRFGVQLRDHPVRTALMVGGFVIAPKMWEQAQFGDDPDYQKLPARTRYRNIIVGKNEDGTFNMVPMPPEYTAIGALAADSMSEMRAQDYVNWRDVSDALVNAYTPPFVSGASQGLTQDNGPKSALEQSGWGVANSSSVGPIIGTLANQSWTGAPIVSQTYADNSPYMQKDERTSGIAEWLASNPVGKALGLSPMKTDYLLKQYGGDLARLGLPLTSDVGGGTVSNTLLRNFIVDPTFTNNLSRDYYNRVDRVKAIIADVGDGATPPKWYTEEVKKLATGRAKGNPSKGIPPDPGYLISDLNAEKREIQADKKLNAQQKAQRLREVQTDINKIYLDVASRLDAMGVPR